LLELARAEEESVRGRAARVVRRVSITDAAQPGDAREEADGQAAVDEAVVHEHVSEPEDRHADSDANAGGRRRSVQIATNHHERGGDRRVRGREHVVALEAAPTTPVMRTMNAPQRGVPDASVEQPRPRLHGSRHHQRNRRAEQPLRLRAHGPTP